MAVSALNAPATSGSAFRYVRRLPDSPEIGVLLLERGVPFAWGGQIRNPPLVTATGTSVTFSPFYVAIQVAIAKGTRTAIANALVQALAPANGVSRTIESKLGLQNLVESVRISPLGDSLPGQIIRGAQGQPLFRADATPLSPEQLGFRRAATARARGSMILVLGSLLLLGLAWSDRRSVGSRLSAIVIALAAVGLVPWNHLSNFSLAFDPVYYYSRLGGPFTASAGIFTIAGSLVVMGVIAIVRARKAPVRPWVAGFGAAALATAGLLIGEKAASGIALPLRGSTSFLWLIWEIPVFLLIFAFWLAAAWLARIATGRTAVIQLRSAAMIAVAGGAAATFIVWNNTTEQRLQLAMRDVAGLQREDPDAEILLARFGQQLAGYEAPGSRAEVLTRFAVSDLAQADLQVSLGTWGADRSYSSRLDLAQLPFDSVQLAILVSESLMSSEPVIRPLLGPTGTQVVLVVPHRGGGATSVVASPRTRLIAQDPYAALLGFRQPEQTEPPYNLLLADISAAAPARVGSMIWRRLGNEWHGDQIVQTSVGPARAHVEVDLRSWPNRIVRASLIVMLNIAVVGLLWALGAIAEGGFVRRSEERRVGKECRSGWARYA